MMKAAVLGFAILASGAENEATRTYSTTKASGDAVVMHVWGNTEKMPARQIDIQISDSKTKVNVITGQPVVRGRQQKGYFFRHLAGSRWTKDSGEQKIETKEEYSLLPEEGYDLLEKREAIITYTDGEPRSVRISEMLEAKFDIAAAKAEIKKRIADLQKQLEDPEADHAIIQIEISSFENTLKDLERFNDQGRFVVECEGRFEST